MKKLFIVLAVASLGFVACNNEAATTDSADSTAKQMELNVEAAKDAVNNTADSAAAVIDSTANAVIDSLKK